jgi:hypothetical protein
MRTLLVVLAVALLATPALADAPQFQKDPLPNCLTVKLTPDTKFRLTIDPTQPEHKPEFMGFKISHRTEGVLNETKGDPMLFMGGKFVGYWPAKHLTYVLANGVRITGHADQKNGNPHSFEIFHLDGSMTLIRKADTTKPVVKKIGKIQAWFWKKLHQKPTYELHLD